VAVEYIAQTGPTATWRDPEVTKVALLGPDNGRDSVVLTDSETDGTLRAPT